MPRFLPWEKGEPNGEYTAEDCVISKFETFAYVDIECDFALCMPCQFSKEHIFTMKGLPNNQNSQNFIEQKYIFLDKQLLKGNLIFQGLLGKTYLKFDRSSNTWKLIRNGNEENIIGMFKSSTKFPLGLNTWNLKLNENNTYGEKQLKLTKVSEQGLNDWVCYR